MSSFRLTRQERGKNKSYFFLLQKLLDKGCETKRAPVVALPPRWVAWLESYAITGASTSGKGTARSFLKKRTSMCEALQRLGICESLLVRFDFGPPIHRSAARKVPRRFFARSLVETSFFESYLSPWPTRVLDDNEMKAVVSSFIPFFCSLEAVRGIHELAKWGFKADWHTGHMCCQTGSFKEYLPLLV